MARGIPIPSNQLPRTQTDLGGFQKSAGIEGLNTDNSASIRAAGNTVQADPRGFIVSAASVGAIGQAIAGEGQAMMALQLKQNEAIQIRLTQSAQAAMDDEAAAIAQAMQEEPDELKWPELVSKRSLDFKNLLLKQPMAPETRDRISAGVDLWATRQGRAAKLSSAKRSFDRAGEETLGAIIRDTNAGKFTEARERAVAYVAAGYAGQDWLATIEGQMKQRAELNIKKAAAEAFDMAEDTAVKAAAEGGEEATLKALDSGAFGKHSPASQEKLRKAIKETANGRAAEVIEELSNGIAGNVYSAAEHIDAYDSVHFTPALRAKAKAMLEGFDAAAATKDRNENGVRNAVEMRQKVKAYDSKADPDRTQFFTLLQEVKRRVPESQDGTITQELYLRYGSTPPKAAVVPAIQKNVTATLDRMFDPETGSLPWKTKVPVLYPSGRPVLDETNAPKTTTKEDPELRQKAINAQTVVELGMAEWFKENPDKADNLPAVQAKLQSLLPEGTRAGALDTLRSLSTKPAASVAPGAEPPNLGAPGDNGPAGPAGALDETLVDAVKEMETFIPEAYGDYKQTSVGYGTRAKSDGEVLTQEEADARLREELTMHAGRIDTAAQKAGLKLTDNQRNALISFDFNTGSGAYLLETSAGDLSEVKRRLKLYTKAGGEELKGLVNRRKREAAMFDK